MTPAECRNGHDLSVLGRGPDNRCIACKRKRQARYEVTPKGKARNHRYSATSKGKSKYARYHATVRGQVVMLQATLKYRLKSKEARVAELERELQYAST